MNAPIYLDHHATTPIAPDVLAAMMPFLTEHFGNPGSPHGYGWVADAAIKTARTTIAQAINASPEEIIFTSGATEANNLAIKGVAEVYFNQGKHLVTLATEHSAVLGPCRYLESLGFEVTIVPVQADGLVDLNVLEQALREDTILVSVMVANNEIGVLQPIQSIGKLCHDRNILFHTDAAQALGYVSLDVQAMQIDLMSLTAHKVYGPKGIGALYVRRRNPRVQLAAQLQGGDQERSLRSGTLSPPQIVGFAKAVEIAIADLPQESQRLAELRDRLLVGLSQALGSDGFIINGSLEHRLSKNLNISIPNIDASALTLALSQSIALSSGSACTSQSLKPSHVLQAIGRSPDLALASLRFGLGRGTTMVAIEKTIEVVVEAVEVLGRSQ
jgi:cysteine desulfurase